MYLVILNSNKEKKNSPERESHLELINLICTQAYMFLKGSLLCKHLSPVRTKGSITVVNLKGYLLIYNRFYLKEMGLFIFLD